MGRWIRTQSVVLNGPRSASVGSVLCFYTVLRGGHVADLPGPVHLITEAPVLRCKAPQTRAFGENRSTGFLFRRCNID